MDHLAVTNGPIFGSAVYFCERGKRHLVRDGEVITQLGFEPADVRLISEQEMSRYRPAQVVPRLWGSGPPGGTSLHDMREYISRNLTGLGLEIGAWASPYPVPLSCEVIYADVFDYNFLIREGTKGFETYVVIPTVVSRFEELGAITSDSLDFLIASHVIEHTTNPIQALINALDKLRIGGVLLLTIPDSRETPDRARPLTTLDHVLLDFYDPSPQRDTQHYKDASALIHPDLGPLYEEAWKRDKKKRASIHFHVWTYETFMPLIKEIRALCPSSIVVDHSYFGTTEFYIIITKIA